MGLFNIGAQVAAGLLRRLDAETAHLATIGLLRAAGPLLPAPNPDDPRLAVRALGLDFPNPVGLAAGFDKNARVPDAMAAFGFGFVECGTVTPRPQAGNPLGLPLDDVDGFYGRGGDCRRNRGSTDIRTRPRPHEFTEGGRASNDATVATQSLGQRGSEDQSGVGDPRIRQCSLTTGPNRTESVAVIHDKEAARRKGRQQLRHRGKTPVRREYPVGEYRHSAAIVAGDLLGGVAGIEMIKLDQSHAGTSDRFADALVASGVNDRNGMAGNDGLRNRQVRGVPIRDDHRRGHRKKSTQGDLQLVVYHRIARRFA